MKGRSVKGLLCSVHMRDVEDLVNSDKDELMKLGSYDRKQGVARNYLWISRQDLDL